MIRSFRCDETEAIFRGEGSAKLHHIQQIAARRLRWLAAAGSLQDLAAIKSVRLEALEDDDEEDWLALRIDDQWTVCGAWADDGPFDVEIVGIATGGPSSARPEPIEPLHPGDLLRDELIQREIGLGEVAAQMHMPLSRLSLLANGHHGITSDMAYNLAEYFGTSTGLWMSLQRFYEEDQVRLGTHALAVG